MTINKTVKFNDLTITGKVEDVDAFLLKNQPIYNSSRYGLIPISSMETSHIINALTKKIANNADTSKHFIKYVLDCISLISLNIDNFNENRLESNKYLPDTESSDLFTELKRRYKASIS